MFFVGWLMSLGRSKCEPLFSAMAGVGLLFPDRGASGSSTKPSDENQMRFSDEMTLRLDAFT